MSELDKTLKAIADLCPENIPEIESLPIPELKIGDQCLLVWSDQMEFWRVKSFCANDGVDIVDDKFNAHMEVPRNELRLASDLLNARQSEIDDLKRILTDADLNFNAANDEIKKLKAEKLNLQNLVKSLRSEFDLNGGSDQVERQIELLEGAVRGQAKPQKPMLGKTAIGDCLHFCTTMFHDGKATCFGCDAVVNHDRKVIGVMEVKTLRGGHE